MFGCCCQSGGTVVGCLAARRMYVWFEQPMFINTKTCGMFRVQTEVLKETAPDYSGTSTTITQYLSPYPYAPTKTTTYADPNFPPRFLCDVSQRIFYDQYSNAAGYGYKYYCGGRDSVFQYDVTYSTPITLSELHSQQGNLEAYSVQNWDTLVSQSVAQVNFDQNYQPKTSISSITIPHYCSGNFSDVLNSGSRGWAGFTTSLYPLTITNQEWRTSYIRFVSWFSKVRLTKNYRVRAFPVTSTTSPGYCSGITPMRFFGGDGTYGTGVTQAVFVCSAATVQQYTDGYDSGNQPRSVIFGPVDRSNHMLLVECLQ